MEFITANQIAYANHLETQRHNVVTERQNADDVRSRATSAAASYWNAQTNALKAAEEHRHNTVTEDEAYRHNKMSEGVEQSKLEESIRSNREKESISWFQAQTDATYKYKANEIAARQATASEAQAAAATLRAQNDAARVDIERYNSETNRQNALSNSIQAAVAQKTATIREQELAQRKVEASETARKNRAGEAIEWASVAERQRSDMANEYLTASRNAETSRSNIAYEHIQTSAHMENVRHNLVTEGLSERDVTTRAKDAETRAGRAKVQNFESGANIAGTTVQAFGTLAKSIMGILG